MKRRQFLLGTGIAAGSSIAGLTLPAHLLATQQASRIRWRRAPTAALFSSVSFDGAQLAPHGVGGLLDARIQLWQDRQRPPTVLRPTSNRATHGPLSVELRHTLSSSDAPQGKNVLRAVLRIRNDSDRPQQVEICFTTSAQPCPDSAQQLYLPLSAAGLQHDQRFAALGASGFLSDCRQQLGQETFTCHYLEPQASHPDDRTTTALLLVPVVHIQHPQTSCRLALFTSADKPVRFRSLVDNGGNRSWHVGRVVTLPPHANTAESCWLMIHTSGAIAAWQAFHRHAHSELHPALDWPRAFRVHYYDFLSSAGGRNGHRGDGYDADVPHFPAFHVGMATQHGYYPALGDFIHPDRKEWSAMRGDKHGAVHMTIDKMAARIRATRAAGAKAAIYMHLTLFDDSSGLFPKLRDARRVGEDGQPMPYPWHGPDVAGTCWWMSVAAQAWRQHLLQQAQWIMEILNPDAICVDETFAGIGYDQATERVGPISPHAISFFRDLRTLVRSFGPDKAVFTSDCSMSAFVLWADGDVGDHAYPGLLGNPLFRQAPVRYLGALGEKPWRPCAWHFQHMWKYQMALARQVGAGVGVSNGWLEYTGLHNLPANDRVRIIRDIESLRG